MKNTFTKQKVTNFRKDFQDAVLELEKKYGVTIKLGTLTYDDTSVRGKMSAVKGDRDNILTTVLYAYSVLRLFITVLSKYSLKASLIFLLLLKTASSFNILT